MNWEVWGPPLAVFGVSAAVGLIMVLRFKSEANQTTQNKDLLARKQQLIEQLRELEADQNKLSPEAYQTEREQLVSQAAKVLEQLENPDARSGKATTTSELSTSFLATFAVLLVLFGGILYGVTQFAKPRAEGQIMTGGETSILEGSWLSDRLRSMKPTDCSKSENNLGALDVQL